MYLLSICVILMSLNLYTISGLDFPTCSTGYFSCLRLLAKSASRYMCDPDHPICSQESK